MNEYVYYIASGDGAVYVCYTLREANAAVVRALRMTGEAHVTKTLRSELRW